MSGAAHRGVLTSALPSHLHPDGRLEDFFARRLSQCQHTADQLIARYRRRMGELADRTDEMAITTRGGKQPSGVAYQHRATED